MEKKSEKQREALRTLRNKELKAVHTLDPGFSCQGLVGKFIGTYIQAEVFAKKLQLYYRKDTNKSGKNELQINTLKAALKHFNLSVPEPDIPILFRGGSGNRGSKSARQLRNGYLHALSLEDKKEIMLKANLYIPKLQKFIKNKIVAI